MEFRQVTIIQTLGPHSYVIHCNYCQGKGQKPTGMDTAGEEWKITQWVSYDLCRICDGKGVIRVESPDILVYDPLCNGTGHLNLYNSFDSAVSVCSKCQGLGVRSLSGGEAKVIKK